jgi:hypothetical protein
MSKLNLVTKSPEFELSNSNKLLGLDFNSGNDTDLSKEKKKYKKKQNETHLFKVPRSVKMRSDCLSWVNGNLRSLKYLIYFLFNKKKPKYI